MSLDFLPPQAYTKETLLKAYNWLQSQSDQVREMATTPDQLVSLFLKASRHGQETVDRPSIQNFKSELKNLAGMMDGLEKNEKKAAPTAPSASSPQPTTVAPAASYTPPPTQSTVVQSAPSTTVVRPTATTPQQAPVSDTVYQTAAAAPLTSSASTMSAAYVAGGHAVTAAPQTKASSLDELTQSLIREVKNELNLSSDHEALRMLVKIGYQKVRSLYK